LYPSAKELLGGALSGPRTPIELRRVLSDVRSAGVASEQGEVTPGQASLARAVVDAVGYPVAAVAVTYPADYGSPGLLEDVKRHLDRTVRALTQRLSSER
jgi:DNA-binding IclR family transcriptional regulator